MFNFGCDKLFHILVGKYWERNSGKFLHISIDLFYTLNINDSIQSGLSKFSN